MSPRARIWEAGPGMPQPSHRTVLVDAHGSRWTRDNGKRQMNGDGRDGWALAGTQISLRWTSPAMRTAGPFREALCK